jgi:diphthamide synthase subunit DPH2
MDQATPNRISKAWVRRRVGVVINQLNEQLTDEQIKSVIEALQRAKLI